MRNALDSASTIYQFMTQGLSSKAPFPQTREVTPSIKKLFFSPRAAVTWASWMGLQFYAPTAAATPLYLSPQHILATGEKPKSVLEKITSDIDVQTWVKVRSAKGQEGWVKWTELIAPIALSQKARLKSQAPVRLKPYLSDLPLTSFQNQKEVQITGFQGSWIKIRSFANPDLEGWVESNDLTPTGKDIGYLVNTRTVNLHLDPFKSAKFTTLAVGQWLRPVKFEKSWLKVEYKNETGASHFGYLAYDDTFLSRLKIASQIRTKEGQKQKTQVVFGKDKIFEIEIHEDWYYSGANQVLLRDSPDKLSKTLATISPFAPLIRLDEKRERWGKAVVDGSPVWWPILTEESLDSDLSKKTFSIQELKKRELFDLAQNPTVPTLAFASARGVFKTTDSKTWHKIEEFQEENHVMAVAKNGTVFIGDKRSSNNGETFEPYIRWDSLLDAISNKNHLRNTKLLITKIEPKNASGQDLILTLDVGYQNLKVRSFDGGQSWYSF